MIGIGKVAICETAFAKSGVSAQTTISGLMEMVDVQIAAHAGAEVLAARLAGGEFKERAQIARDYLKVIGLDTTDKTPANIWSEVFPSSSRNAKSVMLLLPSVMHSALNYNHQNTLMVAAFATSKKVLPQLVNLTAPRIMPQLACQYIRVGKKSIGDLESQLGDAFTKGHKELDLIAKRVEQVVDAANSLDPVRTIAEEVFAHVPMFDKRSRSVSDFMQKAVRTQSAAEIGEVITMKVFANTGAEKSVSAAIALVKNVGTLSNLLKSTASCFTVVGAVNCLLGGLAGPFGGSDNSRQLAELSQKLDAVINKLAVIDRHLDIIEAKIDDLASMINQGLVRLEEMQQKGTETILRALKFAAIQTRFTNLSSDLSVYNTNRDAKSPPLESCISLHAVSKPQEKLDPLFMLVPNWREEPNVLLSDCFLDLEVPNLPAAVHFLDGNSTVAGYGRICYPLFWATACQAYVNLLWESPDAGPHLRGNQDTIQEMIQNGEAIASTVIEAADYAGKALTNVHSVVKPAVLTIVGNAMNSRTFVHAPILTPLSGGLDVAVEYNPLNRWEHTYLYMATRDSQQVWKYDLQETFHSLRAARPADNPTARPNWFDANLVLSLLRDIDRGVNFINNSFLGPNEKIPGSIPPIATGTIGDQRRVTLLLRQLTGDENDPNVSFDWTQWVMRNPNPNNLVAQVVWCQDLPHLKQLVAGLERLFIAVNVFAIASSLRSAFSNWDAAMNKGVPQRESQSTLTKQEYIRKAVALHNLLSTAFWRSELCPPATRPLAVGTVDAVPAQPADWATLIAFNLWETWNKENAATRGQGFPLSQEALGRAAEESVNQLLKRFERSLETITNCSQRDASLRIVDETLVLLAGAKELVSA